MFDEPDFTLEGFCRVDREGFDGDGGFWEVVVIDFIEAESGSSISANKVSFY